MLKELDKKSFQYLGIVAVIAALVFGGLFYYLSQSQAPEEIEEREVIPEKSEKEKLIEQQLQELKELRGETEPLSEEEIQKQLEELDKLR